MTEARKLLPELADNAKHHNEITILTRQGKDIAAICPIPRQVLEAEEVNRLPKESAEEFGGSRVRKPPKTAGLTTRMLGRKFRA